jgi:hypothetical protein
MLPFALCEVPCEAPGEVEAEVDPGFCCCFFLATANAEPSVALFKPFLIYT